jgi:hypothetical protein
MYQTRHTYATLMLATGENPEWIAKQLGHTSTQMLFQRYAKFVPNVTHRDGAAFLEACRGWFDGQGRGDADMPRRVGAGGGRWAPHTTPLRHPNNKGVGGLA